MHFQCPRPPKLTQLQARFAASFGASLFLVAIYLFLSSPRLAYALEVPEQDSGPSAPHSNDHNWFRLEEPDDIEFAEHFDDSAALEVLMSGQGLELETVMDSGSVASDGTPLEKRQASATASPLPGNNNPVVNTIKGDQTQQWVFLAKDVYGPPGEVGTGLPGEFDTFVSPSDDEVDFLADELASIRRWTKRDDPKNITVFVSMNTCSQPVWTGTGEPDGPPPQLTLYISLNGDQPGPTAASEGQIVSPLDEGFTGSYLYATGPVYIAVAATSAAPGYTGGWNYSIAASIDDYYHDAFGGASPLYLVDTDTTGALMVTENVTQAQPTDPEYNEWMNLKPVPFIVFGQPFDRLQSLVGMRQSFCAMQTLAEITSDAQDAQDPMSPIQMQMTTRGLGSKPKQQFYLRALNATSTYSIFIAMRGNSSASGPGVVGGGGKMWSATNLTTKSYGNCQLLFDLPFCDSVAYAVPSNPYTYNTTAALANFYDSYASQAYSNFSLSLQIVPCNATATSRYSLSHDCDDCAAAYKAWLCAVTIPRCMDYGTPQLQPRNVAQAFINNDSTLPDDILNSPYNAMQNAPAGSLANQQIMSGSFATNQSRNARIDSMVRPGPYAELLPCADLCYDLVRNCPASLQFNCPTSGRGLEVSYGQRSNGPGVSCSFAGAVYQLGAGSRLTPPFYAVMLLAVAATLGASLLR